MAWAFIDGFERTDKFLETELPIPHEDDKGDSLIIRIDVTITNATKSVLAKQDVTHKLGMSFLGRQREPGVFAVGIDLDSDSSDSVIAIRGPFHRLFALTRPIDQERP